MRETHNSHTCPSSIVTVTSLLKLCQPHPPLIATGHRDREDILSKVTGFEETLWQWKCFSPAPQPGSEMWPGPGRGADSPFPSHGAIQTRVLQGVVSTGRHLVPAACIHLDKPITPVSAFSSLTCQRTFFRAAVVNLAGIVTRQTTQRHLRSRGRLSPPSAHLWATHHFSTLSNNI